MAQVKYDDARRAFLLEDGSIVENLNVIDWQIRKESTPVYEFGNAQAHMLEGMTITTMTVEYDEPEAYSLPKDIKGWKTEVEREEIRKKSEEIVNDFKR